MNYDIDEILLKLQSVVDDEKNSLFVCDKENCKLLLNYIDKLNILVYELYNIVDCTICNDDCKNYFKNKYDNLKKYEEILYDEE